ncbi:MAG: hypothetical protein PF638_00155 [Candidatus Delongbacteria bacterium]|jgi:hypothetical protein|nr:hypothetical protein [Candidatus Delongbacteria bacterium]
MLKKFLITVFMVFLLTITVLSCSDDSNPSDPVASTITLTSPVGGEILMPDSTEIVSWKDNIEEAVRIELYKNSILNLIVGDSIQSVGDSIQNICTYDWTVPSDIEEGIDYRIKIVSVDDSTLYDESENDFKITSVSSVTITEPNGNEIWNVGGQRAIKWNYNSKGKVKIELYKNSLFYQVLKDSADNIGIYDWSIPIDLPQESDYQIKITNVTDDTITDMSDDFFSASIPLVYLFDTSDIISNAEYKVQWYGNSNDSTNLNYYYCITTDTTITNLQAEATLVGLWNETLNNYADVSFPMEKFNSTELFIDSTTYIDTVEAIEVTRKVVFSKFFVYGVDEYGSVTEIASKVFGRMNKRPKFPMVKSEKLEINGYDQYTFNLGPELAELILPNETSFWKPIDFEWFGEDPDGAGVDLEFKWELWALNPDGTDIEIIDLKDWSTSNLSVEFSSTLYNYSAEGKYSFRVWVRDDALEEADNHATVNFSVYTPQFDRGILFIDDTDPTLYSLQFSSSLYMGNPNPDSTSVFYESLLRYAGYKPEIEVTDSLNLYRIIRFLKKVETIGWDYIWGDHDGNPTTADIIVDSLEIERGYYSPDIRELLKYRMVIIASDDRSNSNGIDFNGTLPYKGYYESLSDYLNVGGKVMILGNSALMGKLYTSPDQLPIMEYKAPFRQIFDPYAAQTSTLTDGSLEFFRDYFGVSSMTFPEQKTYFTENSSRQRPDYKYSDNYDFIGITPYDYIDDMNIKEMRIDSIRVNDAWWDTEKMGAILKLSLKDNGTVFTGVPTMETFKGEAVYKYKSIYELPFEAGSDSTTIDGDIIHSLQWEDRLLGETGPVLKRSGTVATRYISDGDIYRTAFFGIPTYFLDNSENQVSDMFSAMIDWFDLEIDPADNWK